MKRLLACLAICASLSASAQVVYPYNPDANGDSQITSGDLLDFLPVFATSFTPQVITIDGVPLDQWLDDLEAVVNGNAASIEALFAMQSQINSLEAANSSLQNQINSLQNQLDNLSFNVDGLPPCVDIDADGICDYADACAPIAIQFEYVGDDGVGWIWSDYLSYGESYTQAFLYEANLIGACLVGIELLGADLSLANLSGADLSLANLFGAYLVYANLYGADLSLATLTSVQLYGADLTGANLSGADLVFADLASVQLYGADLTGANLLYADLSGADLSGADLTGATMTCLYGCPSTLPSGYICEPDPDCSEPDRYRIVPE